MLSDRFRWLKIGLLVALALGLGALHAHRSLTYEVGYKLCMTDPEFYDGHIVYLSLWGVEENNEGSYTLQKFDREVPVIGELMAEPGDTVSVAGHFDASQQAVIQDTAQIHHLRKIKAALGMLGALLAVIYTVASFRLENGWIVLRGWSA